MPVEITLPGPLRAEVQQTELSPGTVRAESDYRVYMTFSHLRQQDLDPRGSPIAGLDLGAFNCEGPLKIVWPGIRTLENLPEHAQLLFNLVARTYTAQHTVTHAVVATASVGLPYFFTSEAVKIVFRDRSVEGILNWGLQDGPAPSVEKRKKAVEKGFIQLPESDYKLNHDGTPHQTGGGAYRFAKRTGISNTYFNACELAEQFSKDVLDDISKNHNRRPMGVNEAISYNMPFYSHHYPIDGQPVSVPSFVCFNKRALPLNADDAGLRHALIRLLNIALHDQGMTVERFVGVVTEQMQLPAKTDAVPSAEFYRAVHASVLALVLPAQVQPYRYDGSCFKTTAVRPVSARAGGASSSSSTKAGDSSPATPNDMDDFAREFDVRCHIMSDQLALWGQECNIALDCEDGCLMSKQLFHLVRQVFKARGGAYGDEGRCWASVLDLFEPLCTRNFCRPAGAEGGQDSAPPISHILLLLVDRMTFAQSLVRGCKIREEVEGPSEDLSATVFRLQDAVVAEQRPWVRHLGFFAAETTAWQVPHLTLAELAHGEPDEGRLDRLRAQQEFLQSKYRSNTPYLRDYSLIKNQHFDVARSERKRMGREAYVQACVQKPWAHRLYSFYHVITNGDVDEESICQPSPADEPQGRRLSAVVFNSLLDEQPMQCGTFLQRLALAPEKAVLVPVGPFVTHQQYQQLKTECLDSQWPSLYFIDESLRASGLPAVERNPLDGVSLGGDVLLSTPKRSAALMPSLVSADIMPPQSSSSYHGGGRADGLLCFKTLVRAGMAAKTSFAEALAGFIMGTDVGDFRVAGWDYFRYTVAETHGVEDANTLYLVRVFFRRSTVYHSEPDARPLAAPAAGKNSCATCQYAAPRLCERCAQETAGTCSNEDARE